MIAYDSKEAHWTITPEEFTTLVESGSSETPPNMVWSMYLKEGLTTETETETIWMVDYANRVWGRGVK